MRFIGSKKGLLQQIDSVLSDHVDGSEKTFVDLFAGSNAVGQYFTDRYKIFSNDIMYFSYVMAKGSLGITDELVFSKLAKLGIDDPLKYLNSHDLAKYPGGYVTQEYTPAGKNGRMYFTIENGKRIDFVRETIESWRSKDLISKQEYFYLLNSLLQAVPFISNITGTYGAYLKKWDKRAYKSLDLVEPEGINGHRYVNNTYNMDSLSLIDKLKHVDIVYIDTPYNTRQYPSNYHVLENLAKWEKPNLKGVTGQMDLDDEKSLFAMKKKAKAAMTDLLSKVDSKHALISYSTDGIIDYDDLLAIVKDNAKESSVDVRKLRYRKYKSKIHNDKEVYEILIYFKPKSYVEVENISLFPTAELKSVKSVSQPKGYIKSPLNYIGGKYKLLPQIMPLFPTKVSTFVDLFSGGANVGINVGANKIIFNDINTKINELFRYFQNHTSDELLASIHQTIGQYQLSKQNENGFKKLRNDYNESPDPLALYVLVAYSFNYQFRFNNHLEYNNPFGRNRSHFSDRMEKNLIRFVDKLHHINAKFTDHYFAEFDFNELDRESFVYADPPYLITTGSYNDGNRGFCNWTDVQEEQLYGLLDELNKNEIKFAMSNVLTHKGKTNDKLAEWSKKYNVHHLNYDYSNSSHNTAKMGSDEVLITNY